MAIPIQVCKAAAMGAHYRPQPVVTLSAVVRTVDHNYIGFTSASPTACLLRGYGRAGILRGGHFEYRHAHVMARAMDMPSATPR